MRVHYHQSEGEGHKDENEATLSSLEKGDVTYHKQILLEGYKFTHRCRFISTSSYSNLVSFLFTSVLRIVYTLLYTKTLQLHLHNSTVISSRSRVSSEITSTFSLRSPIFCYSTYYFKNSSQLFHIQPQLVTTLNISISISALNICLYFC